MRAMILQRPGERLRLVELPLPEPGPGQIRVRVTACGVCRTDLHVVDGELPDSKRPVVPGHQIVGVVEALGAGAGHDAGHDAGRGAGHDAGDGDDRGDRAGAFAVGDRVGVPWLGGSCGRCAFCARGDENLCDEAVYTGYQVDGGFAEHALADARFAFRLPEGYPDAQAAPLLCAGLIGWRALRMAGDAEHLGFYGFGAAAHILVQVARWQGRRVSAFVRPGDDAAAAFARSLGAHWAGGSDEAPPEPLDAALIFAPVGALVPAALARVRKGGTVVCAGIHMSDIPGFPYALLWGERVLRSVANLTRRDGEEFLAIAPRVPVRTEVRVYPLERAGEALDDLRAGAFTGAAVVVPRGRDV